MTTTRTTLAALATLAFFLHCTSGEIISKSYPHAGGGSYGIDDYLINKISLSQIGYVQFLKYMADVPPLPEFTFCVWTMSTNLTHPHPLLSYSRNEKERLIRVWLGASGRDVNMAILEVEVFKVPINLFENHWNHICSSWNSKRATWQLFVNGKLREAGVTPQLKDVIIPGEGDIVVGQEYTDFDKGLDDGMEGDIFGFNMILSSALLPKSQPSQVDFNHRRQIFIPQRQPFGYQVKESDDPVIPQQGSEIPGVLSYFKMSPNREPKGLMDIGRNALQDFYNILETNPRIRVSPPEFHQLPFYSRQGFSGVRATPPSTKRIYAGGASLKNDLEPSGPKPLGLALVELGYNRCSLGRGAPINDNKVIVSWTRTPVRIFGGAILKSVAPFCRKF